MNKREVSLLLTSEEIRNNLKELNEWSYENSSIQKIYSLKDFSSVLAFVVKVGLEAEKMDHHPDILIHSWNKCKITILTHSAGGVTEKDFALAEAIEKLQ